MTIYGPYKDLRKEAAAKRANEKLRREKGSEAKGRKRKPRKPKLWYLIYSAPVLGKDGTMALGPNGSPVLERHRPYYKTKDAASADKDRILRQHSVTGSGEFIFGRKAADDYEEAKKIVGEKVMLVEVARFWRLHHPEQPKQRIDKLIPQFLDVVKDNLGDGRHWSDLKSRLTMFGKGFGNRYPDTITREDILKYVRTLKNQDGTDAAPRTRRNHKTSICNLCGWLCEKGHITANPAGGIKKRMLPREIPKEIEFLPLDYVVRYLRAAERYDPNLVAHEVVQLISGVRSDDEMANFEASFVLPNTKEVKIPASIAKTGKREVIDGLEASFWAWWKAYGPKTGLLRPSNYEPRWKRLRVLAATDDQGQADRLARLPIKTLLADRSAAAKLKGWPWNARRRSFCSYHIAMHQSADKTALILRHRGSAATLHESYRGTGITQDEGRQYFQTLPSDPRPVAILPEVVPRGVIKQQAERRLTSAAAS